MYTILEADLLPQSVMLTQPSDEIRALSSLRGMHRAVLLQDAVMSYSSFPYAIWLSPNKLHEYKQFYLQFFAYIFLAYSDYGFSQPDSCSCGSPSILLYSEPKGAFKNICRKFSFEYAVFVFMAAITWHLFKNKRERKRKRRLFTLENVCLLQSKRNKHVN